MTDPRPAAGRLPALDWLRGLAMAVMAVDHADALFDPRHCLTDAVWMQSPERLPTWEFLTRWCTHLCAPTFVFLAGAGMALSVARAEAAGTRPAAIDRHWLLRGAVLVLLEVTFVSACWRFEPGGPTLMLQVLYALGAGLMAMTALRRLPAPVLLALALLLPVLVELLYQPPRFTGFELRPESAPLPMGLLVSGGVYAHGFLVFYPVLPWLTPLLLGWLFGQRLASAREPSRLPRALAWQGVLALAVFVLLRGWNGPGNLGLVRRDGSLLEWLHCSKYPPSATFLALELGLMALLLAAFLQRQRAPRAGQWRNHPLLVLGQVPLFFYLLHLPVLGAWLYLGVFRRPGSWWWSWLIAAATVVFLYPLCGLYRHYKQTRRRAWTRYL